MAGGAFYYYTSQEEGRRIEANAKKHEEEWRARAREAAETAKVRGEDAYKRGQLKYDDAKVFFLLTFYIPAHSFNFKWYHAVNRAEQIRICPLPRRKRFERRNRPRPRQTRILQKIRRIVHTHRTRLCRGRLRRRQGQSRCQSQGSRGGWAELVWVGQGESRGREEPRGAEG